MPNEKKSANKGKSKLGSVAASEIIKLEEAFGKTTLSEDVGYDADTEGLENFRIAFQKRFGAVVGKRISRKESIINRRLDALARLLEREQICVAVRYSARENKLIISSNAIHRHSRRTNQSILKISQVMGLLAKHEATMGEIMDELAAIISDNLRQEVRFHLEKRTLEDIKKTVKKHLASLFKSGIPTKVWQKNVSSDVVGFERELIKRTSILARSFVKLRKSIMALAHADDETRFVFGAMRDKRFSLCRDGSRGEHAEMRQTHALVAHKGAMPYLGISKLCCARCALVVTVLEVPHRGEHGRVFKQWTLPQWLKNDPAALKEVLGPTAAGIYETLTKNGQKRALRIIQDGKQISPAKVSPTKMMPDTSSSDEALGISDSSADDLDMGSIFWARAIKDDSIDEYDALRNNGFSVKQIVDTFNESPDKSAMLAGKQVQQLLRQYPDVNLNDLSELYNRDLALFQHVLCDEADLINRDGFVGAVERYAVALAKAREQAVDEEFFEPVDVDDLAASSYLEENGWDYDELSDDSENRFGYRDDVSDDRYGSASQNFSDGQSDPEAETDLASSDDADAQNQSVGSDDDSDAVMTRNPSLFFTPPRKPKPIQEHEAQASLRKNEEPHFRH